MVTFTKWRIAVWTSVVVAVAVLAAMPFVEAVAGQAAVARAIAASGALTLTSDAVADPSAFVAFQRAADTLVRKDVGPVAVPVAGFATAGPLRIVSVNGTAPSGGAGPASPRATFVDDLASHVDVLAGQLPPEGLGGADPAVTLPQAAADRLGLHMSDRFCASFDGDAGQRPWCGRVVGLWRPSDAADPIWGGAPPPLELVLTRYDFFRLHPPRAAAAGQRYRLDPFQVGRDGVAALHGRLDTLRRDAAADPSLALATSPAAALARIDRAQVAASRTAQLLTGALALLAVTLVAVVSAGFCERHGEELAALRASGWLPPELGRRLNRQLGWLGWLALPAGLVIGLGACAIVLAGYDGASELVRPLDLAGPAVVLVAGLVAIRLVLRAAASTSANREAGPQTLISTPASDRTPGRRRLAWSLLGGGILAVLIASAAGGGAGLPVPMLGLAVGLVPAGAAILLALCAAVALPIAARMPGSQRGELAGTLAGLQFETRPDQHAATGFLVGVGAAAAVVAAYAATLWAMGSGGVTVQGLAAVAPVCGVGCVAALVAGFGLHFLGVSRRRVIEYATLFSDQPTARIVGESVSAEEWIVLRTGVVVGCVIGVVVTLVLPLDAVPTAQRLGIAAACAIAVAVVCLAGAALAGRPARRPRETAR